MRMTPTEIYIILANARISTQHPSPRPCVLAGLFSHWSASVSWCPSHLRRAYGEAQVAVILYDPNVAGTFLEQTAADDHRIMRLREYLDTLAAGDRRYAIREDRPLFRRFLQLLDELGRLSPFCSDVFPEDGRYRTLWIGPADYVTGLHTDPGDTLLIQLYGKKQLVLFAPDQTEFLYEDNPIHSKRTIEHGALRSRLNPGDLAVLRDNVGWAAVSPFAPDSARFRRVNRARGVEAFLSRGDALYIPDRWWHAARSLESSSSVSVEPNALR